MVRKVYMLFRALYYINKAHTLLPHETYQDLTGRPGDKKYRDPAEDQVNEVSRVINGEAVGAPLRPSTSGPEPTHDPATCEHPVDQMRRKGNRPVENVPTMSSWWVCLACRSRWQRYVYQASSHLKAEDVLYFGRHKGKTYYQVFYEHPGYAAWALETVTNDRENASPMLVRFADYVKNQLDEERPELMQRMAANTFLETEGSFPDNDLEMINP